MKIGDTVSQIVQPIVGEIIDTHYDKETNQLKHLVEWQDKSGEPSFRWFFESEIQAQVTA